MVILLIVLTLFQFYLVRLEGGSIPAHADYVSFISILFSSIGSAQSDICANVR